MTHISIDEARRAGIERLRLDVWANPADHVKLTIVKDPRTGENLLGPWWELWSPANERIGAPNPQKHLIVGPTGLGDFDKPCWTVYTEPA